MSWNATAVAGGPLEADRVSGVLTGRKASAFDEPGTTVMMMS